MCNQIEHLTRTSMRMAQLMLRSCLRSPESHDPQLTVSGASTSTSHPVRQVHTEDDSQHHLRSEISTVGKIISKREVDKLVDHIRQETDVHTVTQITCKILGGYPSASFAGAALSSAGFDKQGYVIPADMLLAGDPTQRPGDIHYNPAATDHRIGGTLDVIVVEKITGDIEMRFMQGQSSVGTTQFIRQTGAWYISGDNHIGGWKVLTPKRTDDGQIKIQFCSITQGSADIVAASFTDLFFRNSTIHVPLPKQDFERISEVQAHYFERNPEHQRCRVIFYEADNPDHCTEYFPAYYKEACLRATASPTAGSAFTVMIDPQQVVVQSIDSSVYTKPFPNVGAQCEVDMYTGDSHALKGRKGHDIFQAQQIVRMDGGTSSNPSEIARVMAENKAFLLTVGIKGFHLSSAKGRTIDVTDHSRMLPWRSEHEIMLQTLGNELELLHPHCKLQMALCNAFCGGISWSRTTSGKIPSLEPIWLVGHGHSGHCKQTAARQTQAEQMKQLCGANPAEFYGYVHKMLYKSLLISAERIRRKPMLIDILPRHMTDCLGSTPAEIQVSMTRIITLINRGQANQITPIECMMLWEILEQTKHEGKGRRLAVHVPQMMSFLQLTISHYIDTAILASSASPEMSDLHDMISRDTVLTAAMHYFKDTPSNGHLLVNNGLFTPTVNRDLTQTCRIEELPDVSSTASNKV